MFPNCRTGSIVVASIVFASPWTSEAFSLSGRRLLVRRAPTSRLQMLHPIQATKEKDLTATEASANGIIDSWRIKSNSADSTKSTGTLPVDDNVKTLAAVGVGVLGLATFLLTHGTDFSIPSPSAFITFVDEVLADPASALRNVVTMVESMGPMGALYFGAVYTLAEILAIPAFPLTASAGYLFGVTKGTMVVLAGASIAAAISFIIGRTLLRSYVETLLLEYPQFQKIDKAIGKEGFKLMLLLRLSPIFPFALSNYLYGASSVGFLEYFFGTMIGFTPGTIAYVYSGEVGKALTIGGGDTQPLYVYVGGFVLLTAFLKVVADVATGIIEEINDE